MINSETTSTTTMANCKNLADNETQAINIKAIDENGGL